MFIIGDFNLNSWNSSVSQCINNVDNVVYYNYFRPLIDKPTRITKRSVILIDNILTNVYNKHIRGRTTTPWTTTPGQLPP